MEKLSDKDVLNAYSETIPSLIAGVETGVILFATPLAEKLLGYEEPGSLVGIPVEVVIPTARLPVLLNQKEVYTTNLSPKKMGDRGTLVQALMKDGTLIQVDVGLYPVNVNGTLCVLVTVVALSRRTEAIIADIAVSVGEQAKSVVDKALIEADLTGGLIGKWTDKKTE